MKNMAPFRELKNDFLLDLANERTNLRYVFEYEHKHRGTVILEIRDNYLDFYFLGHGIQVTKRRDGRYYLSGSYTFNPIKSISSERLKRAVDVSGTSQWKICLEELEKYKDFSTIMDTVISKIVLHRMGSISEGVSEVNHYFDNRDIGKNGTLIIDRQVVFPGNRHRLDLLGIRRIDDSIFSFTVLELKNKNNIEIGSVFSQLRQYIDIVFENYDAFKKTYEKVIMQKMDLGLLRKRNCPIAPGNKISVKDIKGVVILDNYNIRSDLRQNGLLNRALDDWANQPDKYSFELYVKTNVLDNTFFRDYLGAKELLARYKANNI